MKKQKPVHTINQLVKYICCCLPSDSKISLGHSVCLFLFAMKLVNMFFNLNRLKYMEHPKEDGPRNLQNSYFIF